MNPYEIALILLAGCVLYLALALSEKRPARNLWLVLAAIPALFLAVEGVTEVVTCDETYMLSEITDFQKLSLRQWTLGNFRTSIAVVGGIVNALRGPLGADDLHAQMLAKAVHWLLGVLSLAAIFWIVSRKWIPRTLLSEFSLLYFYGALLLPINILSLKVANYDMFAMLLGILGVLCAFAACENVSAKPRAAQGWRAVFSEALRPDAGFALIGVVLATLAAQEKQIAGPFLNLAIISSVLMRLRRRGRVDWWLPAQIALSIFMVCATMLLTYGLVAIWHPADLPGFDLPGALVSVFPHINIVFQTIGWGAPTLLTHLVLLVTTATLFPILLWWLQLVKDRITSILRLAFPLLLVLALVVGVVGFYKVRVYVHPIHPIPKENFIPRDEINGEIIHFLASTQWQHTIRKIGNAYSIFGTAFPSATVVLALVIIGSLVWKKRETTARGISSGLLAMGALSSFMPLVYVLTRTPVGLRYFDVWIFIPVLILGILGCQLLARVQRPLVRMSIIAVFCFSLFLEVVPFRPIVGAFWPWWANPSVLEIAGRVEPGKMIPIWPGWGEEAMIAGRQLRRMRQSGLLPSDSFRLFTVYPGDWLAPGETTATYWVEKAPYLSFTANDYYVVNRYAVVQGKFRFPVDATPIWTLAYRGFPEAWIFRGTDVRRDE